MNIKLLNKIIKENDIDENVTLVSDSGWECGPTDMDGVFYSKEKGLIIFKQGDADYQYKIGVYNDEYKVSDFRYFLLDEGGYREVLEEKIL